MALHFDETVDFVIVGSGGGSMAAALYLKSLGKTPLIVEKTDKFGGSTAMSGGVLWVPDNHFLKRKGIEDSLDAARTYMDATIGDDAGLGSTPARKEAYLRNGPEMLKWLEDQGMEWLHTEGWSDYYDDRPGGVTRSRSIGAKMLDARKMGPLFDRLRLGPVAMPLPTDKVMAIGVATRTLAGMWEGVKLLARLWITQRRGKPLLSFGAAIQGRMLMLADRAGVDMRTEYGVRELIEEDGRIVGVVANHRGKELRIGARNGVLINAGGFSHNAAMRQQYGPNPATTAWTNANPGDTGEMIEIAQKHGAVLDLMNEAWWVPSSLPPGKDALPLINNADLSKPHSIVVNRHGRRIMNESASYMENGQRLYQNDIPAFAILDSRHRKRYAWGVQPPGKTPPEWLESGFVKQADSIEELAEKAGIDPELKGEVEKFNRYCKTGTDLDFHRGNRGYDNAFGDPTVKPNSNLGAIDKPPFYAIEIFPGDVGTAGGIVTDEFARVLRKDGTAIDGLYATGNSTASVMGRCYPAAGASIAASFIFAWIAAHHAVGANS